MKQRFSSKLLALLLCLCLLTGGIFSLNVSASAADDHPEYNPTLFAADCIIGANKNYDPQVRTLVNRYLSESPAAKLANAIKDNTELMVEMEAWKALTFKPSNDIEQVFKESDYYEGIILSGMKIYTKTAVMSSFLDHKIVKEQKALFSAFKDGLKLLYGDNFASFIDNNCIDVPDDKLNECFKYAFSKTFPDVNDFGDIVSKFSLFVKAGKTIEKSIDNWVAYFTCVKMEKGVKQFVSKLYQKCDPANLTLMNALYKVDTACQSYVDAFDMSFYDTTTRTTALIAEEGVDKLYSAIMAENPYGFAFLLGQAAGKSIANLLWNTDSIVEQSYNLIAFSEFESLVDSVALDCIESYHQSRSLENAEILLASIDFVYANLDDGCNEARTLYDLLYRDNKFMNLLSILDRSVAENYFSAVASLETTQKRYTLEYQGIRETSLYLSIKEEYPDIYNEGVENGEYVLPEDVAERGQCGDNVEYCLCNNGNLIISGKGDMWDYDYYGNNNLSPFSENAAVTRVIIKNGVTSIGDGAFLRCTNLESALIADSVTDIGSCSFEDCTSLQNLKIPDSVTDIDYYAFYNCSSLTTVNIPKKITILKCGVFAQTGLTSVVIPEGVIEIGEIHDEGGPFFGCSKLSSIYIPDSVKTIGDGAFSGCTSLSTIVIPHSVAEIGNAFDRCTSLSRITIPSSVKQLGSILDESGVFWGCTNLQEVIIENGVTEIGMYAFLNCPSLTEIVIPDSVTRIGYEAFDKCDATIYGDSGSYIESFARSNNIPFVALNAPLSNQSTLSDDGIVYGNSITVNCAAQGGKPPYKYAVYYKQKTSSSWTKAQGYSTKANVSIQPKHVGVYTVSVKVKDANGNVDTKDLSLTVSAQLKNTSAISSASIVQGGSVTVSCSSTGGLDTKKYAVWYQNPNNGKWYKAQDYSTKSTVIVKPKQTGAYIIRVNVKDASGKVKKKDFTVKVFAGLKNTSTVSAASIKLGKTVTITAASTGGLGTKQYAVWYRNPNNLKWYKAQDYSANTTVSVKPKQTGAYIIRVNVKDERGKVVKKDYTVNVTK